MKLCVLVGVIVLIAVIIYIVTGRKSSVESYVSAGGIDNVGSLMDDQYEPLQSPDIDIPAEHFADIVSSCDKSPCCESPCKEPINPMERLERIQSNSLMPRTSLGVTPYNIDVANPTSHKYMVNTPRVQTALKSRFKDYSLSSFIRGDIPITYNPNVPLIAKTIQGRDDLRLDGLFSPHFLSLYRRYTGQSQRNIPLYVAGAGCSSSGCEGASSDIIMDQ